MAKGNAKYNKGWENVEGRGRFWTPEDDLYVWEHLKDPSKAIAKFVSRSTNAVITRRVILRKRMRNLGHIRLS